MQLRTRKKRYTKVNPARIERTTLRNSHVLESYALPLCQGFLGRLLAKQHNMTSHDTFDAYCFLRGFNMYTKYRGIVS